MPNAFRWYVRTPIITRMLVGLLLGSAAGVVVWVGGGKGIVPPAAAVAPWVAPFGMVFVGMLKMVVIPTVFFSLITGAASLPLRQFGRVGSRIITWYLLTSVIAACVGVGLAVALNPGSGLRGEEWRRTARVLAAQGPDLAGEPQSVAAGPTTFTEVATHLFQNPFESLATGQFLPLIVAAILFGLASRTVLERSTAPSDTRPETADRVMTAAEGVRQVLAVAHGAQQVVFRIVDWVLEYGPVGVCALTFVNFGLYGPSIAGPYVTVVAGVVGGVAIMMGAVYPLLMIVLARKNPVAFFGAARGALLTAFTTRSSAATLPVTLRTTTERLGVPSSITSFALPLGATINMDGVCVHLPFFAVLAANLFGVSLTPGGLVMLVLMTVLASIGAGGVPGGSVMLLFLVTRAMGLDDHQTATIVGLAMGVNPILDMFETMNNVADDMVCTYVVASREHLINGV